MSGSSFIEVSSYLSAERMIVCATNTEENVIALSEANRIVNDFSSRPSSTADLDDEDDWTDARPPARHYLHW